MRLPDQHHLAQVINPPENHASMEPSNVIDVDE
jgi:hypothetical protein